MKNWYNAHGICSAEFLTSYEGTEFRGRLVIPRTPAVWDQMKNGYGGWIAMKSENEKNPSKGIWKWYSSLTTKDGIASNYPFPTKNSDNSGKCAHWHDDIKKVRGNSCMQPQALWCEVLVA